MSDKKAEPAAPAEPTEQPEADKAPLVSDEQAGELFAARGRLRKAETAEERAKENHAGKKKTRERFQAELNELIDDIAAGQRRLFPVEGEGQEGPGPDAWGAIPLVEIGGIGNRSLKVLSEHKPTITTLGHLSDWQIENGELWAEAIAGIGPKARQQIEDALEKWWAANPEYCKAPTEDTEPADAKAAQ